jgi:hypothetical protein
MYDEQLETVDEPQLMAAPRPSIVRCKVNGLTVIAQEFGKTFVAGEWVDLDAIAVNDITWRDALGAHVDTEFEAEGA